MFEIRKSTDRGRGEHSWLRSWHTFSFADYYDPQQMGFRSLRVMNEDYINPGAGFPTHGHRNMEIISYVLSGELEHRDSLGNGSVLRPGELQRMTAGTGIRHSEFNPSSQEPVHLYQIWILPEQEGLTPSYEQKFFDLSESGGAFRVVASPDARDGSLKINQDAILSLAELGAGQTIHYPLAQDRYAWLQVLTGQIDLAGHQLAAGDGVAIGHQDGFQLQAIQSARVLLFDLN